MSKGVILLAARARQYWQPYKHKKKIKMLLKLSIICVLYFQVLTTNIWSQDFPKAGRKYTQNLGWVITQLLKKQKVSIQRIEAAIPTTDAEFGEYYSYTSPDRDKKVYETFEQLDSIIYNYAEFNKSNFTRKVINMSAFVDGEYAATYFEDVENIIRRNERIFCDCYPKLPKTSKVGFYDLFVLHCKKKK